MFRIVSLTIFEKCKCIKNLKPGTYSFTAIDDSWGDFFGKGITISAIVGKNGSGKSTLLELLFRIINNVNAYLCSHLYHNNEPPVYYIRDIYASLKYVIDNTEYEIRCNDSKISVLSNLAGGCETYEFDFNNPNEIYVPTFEKRVKILSKFFYTIVVNYSPLAYNEKDYNDLIQALDKHYQVSTIVQSQNWLHNLFHKNDGYSVSINLNPFRIEGSINANTELFLTRSRLCALLILYPDQILKGYSLKSIDYCYNSYYFRRKLGLLESSLTNQEIINEHSQFLNKRGSCCYTLLTHLLGKTPNITNEYRKAACLYICIKVFSLIDRYPKYQEFSGVLNIQLLKKFGNKKQCEKTIELANILKKDRSHIALKIRQSIHFYKALYKNPQLAETIHNSGSLRPFTYSLFKQCCKDDSPRNISTQLDILPPPFFDSIIKLNRGKDPAVITLPQLSTGERQFIFSTAAIIYHLLNLKSVPSQSDRIHYRNILVVLDEAELSYHPEYQRTYIKNLIDIILRLKLTRALSIHFLITTHSPFMLSDIPKQNILFLENGVDVGNNMISPFCANISDILSQNFFLSENGFIGEFAKEKVLELFTVLENYSLKKYNKQYSSESISLIIQSIGEHLIRNELWRKFLSSDFASASDMRKEIQQLKDRIRDLEDKANH